MRRRKGVTLRNSGCIIRDRLVILELPNRLLRLQGREPMTATIGDNERRIERSGVDGLPTFHAAPRSEGARWRMKSRMRSAVTSVTVLPLRSLSTTSEFPQDALPK